MRINLILLLLIGAACGEPNFSESQGTGSGGSLSRFAIRDEYLYLVTGYTLNTFSLSDGSFREVNSSTISFGLETIQAQGDFLYLGANDAMYIYSISNRAQPEFIFRYSHIVACDPVVVQGNRAYVILRGGTPCNVGTNQLEIIDITNPYAPVLLAQYAMTSPGGLGIFGDCLFVCEGTAGLKMLRVADDVVTPLLELSEVNAYDVIVKPNSILLTGEDGLFQYAYTCQPPALTLISSIPVQRAEF
ncbi:MAG: hypothetical protein J0L66_03820 [Cytophagales bacterium]|nr:hypothetical protein [Cytophagales bacterium]